jgi:hypothetical protein
MHPRYSTRNGEDCATRKLTVENKAITFKNPGRGVSDRYGDVSPTTRRLMKCGGEAITIVLSASAGGVSLLEWATDLSSIL